jgi:superfamily II DNA or RNA helicase
MMAMLDPGFLDRDRLLLGPWQAFERDTARLMVASGFDDVRIVGGSGDRGADVLGVRGGQLWVFQCKHTTTSPPTPKAVSEVVEAARYYGAHRMIVAVSRVPGHGFYEEVQRYGRLGLHIEVATPEVLLTLMAEAPEYSSQRRALRDYQLDAVRLMREALTDVGRAQVVLATGLGKTVVMAEVVADLFRDNLVEHGRALVLAHTRDLVEQLHRSFWPQLPKWVRTEHLSGSERPKLWDGIIFATVQSIATNVEDMPPVGLVVVDEAHHIGAATFQRVVEVLKPKMLAGATATPWRGDGFDIDRSLGTPVVQYGIADGLKRGFLSEVDYRLCADNIDWSMIQGLSRHKYSLSQLNKRLIIPVRDEQAVRRIREVFDGERRKAGIVFCPSVVHATEFAAMLRRYDFKAEAVSGEMDPRERELLMARFRAGEMDLLTSVDLFNEGVDVPDVDLVVFLRATHSRRIFVQQLGRGLRVTPHKDKVIVLDFVTDIRRIAEVVELDKAAKGGPLERLGLGNRLIEFRDASAGSYMREWMLDQASLALREGDPDLELPMFDFPEPLPPGNVQ